LKLFSQLKKALFLGYLTGFVWLRRDPTSAVYLASTPFAILFLIFMISKGDLLASAVTGSLVMLLMHHGLSLGSDAMIYRLEYKFQDIMVASPISPAAYVVGLALSQLIFAGPATVFLSALIIMSMQNAWQVFVLVLSLLLVWMSGSSLGFFFSTYVPNVKNAAQVTALLSGLLTIVPPVFYPIEFLPPFFQQLSYLIPTTHASLLLFLSAGRQTPSTWAPTIGMLVLLGYTMFFVTLAVFKARWRQI